MVLMNHACFHCSRFLYHDKKRNSTPPVLPNLPHKPLNQLSQPIIKPAILKQPPISKQQNHIAENGLSQLNHAMPVSDVNETIEDEIEAEYDNQASEAEWLPPNESKK